jgi:hypothetical protein
MLCREIEVPIIKIRLDWSSGSNNPNIDIKHRGSNYEDDGRVYIATAEETRIITAGDEWIGLYLAPSIVYKSHVFICNQKHRKRIIDAIMAMTEEITS